MPLVLDTLAACLLTAMLPGSMLLAAQNPGGELSGIVYDQAGARLQQASVTIRQKGAGVERTLNPNDRGEYRFQNLPSGKYSIVASAKGLTSVQIDDIAVQPGRAATINVTLPESRSTPISVVQVTEAREAPPQVSPQKVAAPPPPPEPAEDAKTIEVQVLNPKLIQNEIASLRDRLALSAQQLLVIQAILEERQQEIARARLDPNLKARGRQELIRNARLQSETKFLAVLTENQRDEYQEILRERRERAAQRKQQEEALASH